MTILKGKVALITGSGARHRQSHRGTVRAACAAVAVNYATDEKSAAETVAAIRCGGGSAIALQGDVSKLANIDRLFAARS